ncbi:hypothetical protein [Actinophytocola gossypii]|uniref:Uncharacterized protein n=1 Tax=Actinophytocola gossypii TaxID=2812003 RepID=A0ABT2J1F3_9PSEU|nr:hypothetical protein [Actinophytocola gossypii]MCT2581692.1 hypothetical protein [Actinophytocola gossypii]
MSGTTSRSDSSAEISGLQVCILNTAVQIDAALDNNDRRAFRVWCLRRASLIARVERVLVEAATAA